MIQLFGLNFPLVYIHVGTLFLIVPVILFADHDAFSWIRGKKETLNKKTLIVVHRLVWAGIIVMIATGVFLFWPLRDYFLYTLAFWAKMFFVAVLVANSFFIGKFMHVASERSFESLSVEEKRPLLVSGGISTIGWIGAVTSAVLMSTSDVLVRLLSSILNML